MTKERSKSQQAHAVVSKLLVNSSKVLVVERPETVDGDDELVTAPVEPQVDERPQDAEDAEYTDEILRHEEAVWR